MPAEAQISRVSSFDPVPADELLSDDDIDCESFEDGAPNSKTQLFELAPIKRTFLPNRKTEGRKVLVSSSSIELMQYSPGSTKILEPSLAALKASSILLTIILPVSF